MAPYSRSGAIRFGLKLLGGVVAVLLAMVWEHVEALRLQRQIRSMHKEVDRLVYENSRVQTQINQWMSPSNLDQVAKKEFHMMPPDPQHLIGVQRP